MTSVGQIKRVCPICRQQEAISHCPPGSKVCFWLRCKNKQCGVTVDLRRRIACTPTGETIPLPPKDKKP